MIIERSCPVTGRPITRYVLDGQEWERVSTIAHTLDDTHHLDKWNDRMLLKGVAAAPELIIEAARTPLSKKTELAAIADRAREVAGAKTAATAGTEIHADLEAHLRGDARPTETVRDIMALITGHGFSIGVFDDGEPMTEVRILRPDLAEPRYATAGVAGTADLFLTDRDGRLCVADLKTGKDPLRFGFAAISAQLALYAGAVDCVRDDGTVQKMPMVTGRYGYVIHARPGVAPKMSQCPLSQGQNVVALSMAVRLHRGDGNPFGRVTLPMQATEMSVSDHIENCRTVTDVTFLKATLGSAWLPEHQEYALSLHRRGRIV